MHCCTGTWEWYLQIPDWRFPVAGLTGKFARHAWQNPEFSLLLDFYTALAHALSLKCRPNGHRRRENAGIFDGTNIMEQIATASTIDW